MKNYSSTSTLLEEKTNVESSLIIDKALISRASHMLRAITHKLRCDILQLIHQESSINVTDLYLRMGLEQTVVSQHLAILRQGGYVITQREGKCIYYSLNYQRLQDVQSLVQQIVDK